MDRVMEIGQREAEEAMRALAKVEGIFAGGLVVSVLKFGSFSPEDDCCTGYWHAAHLLLSMAVLLCQVSALAARCLQHCASLQR